MAAPLTTRQLDLLHRITKDGHRPTSDEATSVYALRSRGLVATTSSYAYRTAAPTDAARALLADGAPSRTAPAAIIGDDDDRANDAIPSTPDALMVLLGERGGRLTISKPSERHRAAWRRLPYNTRHQQAAGPDRIVRHRSRDAGDLFIWTEARHSEPMTSELLEPIPIPERVVRPNPLIAALRTARVGADGWIDTRRTGGVVHVRIHRSNKTRTIRLLHAVATEADRRGYLIETVAGHRCPGGFGISINGHPFEITVLEESKRVAHLVTASEQRRLDRGYTWGIPKWDYQPTGRLVFRHGHDSYGGNLAADRTRWTLDDKLPRAFQRLEELAAQAEQRHLRQQRERQEREQRHQQEHEAAEQRRIHQRRVEHLDSQVRAWQHAEAIRDFVTVAATDDPDTAQWLAWAASHADSIDPLIAGITPPEIPGAGPLR